MQLMNLPRQAETRPAYRLSRKLSGWIGFCLSAAIFVLVAGCASSRPGEAVSQAETREAVRQVLRQQQAAWNRGDIAGFMQGYWRSDSLRFASGGNVRYGWETTLQGYREGYPNRASMGRLSFADVDVRALDDRWALAFGRWQIEREEDAPGGLFSLLFRRTEDGPWRIVHDHTSSAR